MLNYFKDPGTGAVTATSYVMNTKRLIEKMQAIEYFLIAFGRKLLDFVDSVYVTPGSLSMFRKKILDEVGGFDVNNITEDIEIAWKVLKKGYKNRMCLSARVGTDVPSTLKQWWRQRLRWNIGGLQTVNKYKSSLFRKKQKMFGLFVVPRFLIRLILSLTGFFIFFYVFGRRVFQYLLYTFYSIQSGNQIFEVPRLFLIPSVFTFFILVLLGFTLIFTYLGLKTLNRANLGFKSHFTIVFYLLFYLTLYPLVLIHSVYRLMMGNIKW
jgi:cellulose synthase/poly-beta-1,6-N-acetylglucosamine synthase-like glycosyltransferase